MLAQRPIVAFIPTTDFAKARAFYEGIIGLSVVQSDNFALVMDANGLMVRITKVDSFTPQPFTILGWEVHNVAQMRERLKAKGIELERYPNLKQDAAGIWTSPSGAKVAWFKDPDGNVLSISQP
jgi:catechol 2,3-dioxygenase-like lactoylglutathione lyase family enzyme